MASFRLIDQVAEEHETVPPASPLYLSDEEEDFVQRFGAIEVEFLKRPRRSVFFTPPYALLYFHNNKLYRMRRELSSSFVELFLDLLYVGIVANLATTATEHASAALLLQYCLLFLGAFQVWADIRDFMNYYYTDDLSQRMYFLWAICLLAIYANNAATVLESHASTAMVVVPYLLMRLLLAASLWWYLLYIKEHRPQMRLYASGVAVLACVWVSVIFVRTRAKVGISIALYVLEALWFCFCYHPWVKKNILKAEYHTALNIEHEVERYSAFYVIAIGEYLTKIVSNSPAGEGIHLAMWRMLMVAIIAYVLMTLYFNGDGAVTATHPLRRNAHTACLWIYGHIPLIAGLILSADAAGDLIKRGGHTYKHEHEEALEEALETALETAAAHAAQVVIKAVESVVESAVEHATSAAEHATSVLESAAEHATSLAESAAAHATATSETTAAAEASHGETESEPLLYALLFFFTGGICVALFALTLLAAICKENPIHPKTGQPSHRVNKWLRILPRIPVGIIILCLLFAEMTTTRLIGLTTLCLGVLFVYELFVMSPECLPPQAPEVADDNGVAVIASGRA